MITKGVNKYVAEEEANSYAKQKDYRCFIATAIYKSENAPEVVFLRCWRDEYLNHYVIGQLFIKFYYVFSPIIVLIINRSKYIEIFIKKIIEKIILERNNY